VHRKGRSHEGTAFFLHHPLGGETDKFSVADNNVIEDPDAHQIARLPEAAGDLDILPARCRISGGVIMDEDDGGSRFMDGGAEHFAGMDDALVEGTFGDSDFFYDAVLAVEKKCKEIFLPPVAVGSVKVIEYLPGRRIPFAAFHASGPGTACQFQCSLDAGGFGRRISARSSASVRPSGPLFRSFSRGRSSSGHCLIPPAMLTPEYSL